MKCMTALLLVLSVIGCGEAGRRAAHNGFMAMGQSFSQPQAVVVEPSCHSDFDCQYGFACIKPMYSGTGTCARKVNQWGNPTFEGPRMDSVGVRTQRQCQFMTDCPIGWRCDFNYGMCVR